jgi:branched-chain amino acid transport system ATP-binding protein
MLQVDSLTKQFGDLKAIDRLSLSIDRDACAVIGPNGAGKTTLFNLISGEIEPTAGRIRFNGTDITGKQPHEISALGLTRTFQISNIFDDLSTLENVRLALQTDTNEYNFWSRADAHTDLIEQAESILDRVGLTTEQDKTAGALSHGNQRQLEIAMALGTDPELLLLDEPTSGMSAENTAAMIEFLGELKESLPLVVIEHNMSVVRNLADHIIVLHQGKVLTDGSPDEIRTNQEVREVYLGQK